MGDAAKKRETVEVPLDRFDRLLVLLERLAQAQERTLAQASHDARRYAAKAGPTTPEAEADVARRLARIRGKR